MDRSDNGIDRLHPVEQYRDGLTSARYFLIELIGRAWIRNMGCNRRPIRVVAEQPRFSRLSTPFIETARPRPKLGQVLRMARQHSGMGPPSCSKECRVESKFVEARGDGLGGHQATFMMPASTGAPNSA